VSAFKEILAVSWASESQRMRSIVFKCMPVAVVSVFENERSVKGRESRAAKLLAELRQMSRVSQREEGLLNHAARCIVNANHSVT
jgi:hypothetical protein